MGTTTYKIIEEYKKGSKENGELLNELIFRPLAFPLVMLAKVLKLTPNMVSIIGFVFTILSGVFLGLGNFIMASIMLFLRHIFDNVDGSLARNLKKFSKAGAYFDAVCDTLGFVFVVIGLGLGQLNETSNSIYILLGILMGISLITQVLAYDNYRGRFIKGLDTYSSNTYEICSFPEDEGIATKKSSKFNIIHIISNAITNFYLFIAPIPKLQIPADITPEEKAQISKKYQEMYKTTFSLMHKLWSLVAGTVITSIFIIGAAFESHLFMWWMIIVVQNIVLLFLIILHNLLALRFRRKVRDTFGQNLTTMSNPFTGREIPI